tara:strand:- start:19 stop:933 length:915 start_codon:yes stop_codon:yes gene_type:complete
MLRPETYRVEDYKVWKEALKKEGFVVLRDIISKDNKEKAITMFKSDLNSISKSFDWEDRKTWTSNNTPIVWGKSSAVFCGFGQCDSNWFLRLNSRAREAFSYVYDTNNIIVSFDGFSLFLSDKQKSTSWLHQDQRPSDERYSIQGIINLLSCNENDAGFICVPKSHVEYQPPDQNTDWVVLPKDSPYKDKSVKILTPERSLILFNSKLIHANVGIQKKHPMGVHINRLSAYITFVPRDRQSEKIRQERIKGYFSGDSCSHWADRYEVKKIPYHIYNKFKKGGFNVLSPGTDEKGDIPAERLELI